MLVCACYQWLYYAGVQSDVLGRRARWPRLVAGDRTVPSDGGTLPQQCSQRSRTRVDIRGEVAMCNLYVKLRVCVGNVEEREGANVCFFYAGTESSEDTS